MAKGSFSDKDFYVVGVRLPASVYARLSKDAQENDRPISLQAVHIIKKYFSPTDEPIIKL
jgi:hypothetical protein